MRRPIKILTDLLKGGIRKIKAFRKPDLISQFSNTSFSQEGEDLVLSRFVSNKSNGFYVDVGAHHPLRYSNTYKFYLKGWRGINIDANPGSMKLFDKVRPLDINLEVPISNVSGSKLTYYQFNEPALNTFDKSLADDYSTIPSFRILNIIELETCTLKEILKKHLPLNQKVDFLSVDVEGLDLEVLQSNDWEMIKPEYIISESLSTRLNEVSSLPIHKFLQEKGYELVSKTFNSLIYKLL